MTAKGRLVPARPEHLPQAPLLLHVHQDDLPQGRRLDAKEVRGELDVDEAIRLQHVLEDDVRGVGIDEVALKLVEGADETRERLEGIAVELLHLRADERRRLSVQRVVEAVLKGPGPAGDVADGLQAHRDVAEDEGNAVAVVVHQAVEEAAQVGEHHLGLGPVEDVVAERQHGEDALGHGHHVAAGRRRRPRAGRTACCRRG